jgi:hypothetical protein
MAAPTLADLRVEHHAIASPAQRAALVPRLRPDHKKDQVLAISSLMHWIISRRSPQINLRLQSLQPASRLPLPPLQLRTKVPHHHEQLFPAPNDPANDTATILWHNQSPHQYSARHNFPPNTSRSRSSNTTPASLPSLPLLPSPFNPVYPARRRLSNRGSPLPSHRTLLRQPHSNRLLRRHLLRRIPVHSPTLSISVGLLGRYT